MATKKTPAATAETLAVTPPNFGLVDLNIEGTSLLVMNRFPSKARDQMIAKHVEGGNAGKNRKKQDARDFEAEAYDASHRFAGDKGYGIPAGAFRNALVRAATFAGLKMTALKGAVFIEADGHADDGVGLVKIESKTKPEMRIDMVKQQTTTTPRARMAFKPGWRCKVRIQFDRDQLSPQDVVNLLSRAGVQVGILEGRPFSSMSAGQGWGTFKVLEG